MSSRSVWSNGTKSRTNQGYTEKPCLEKQTHCQVVAAHAFNPSTREAEAGRSREFNARLVYRESSRTTRTVA